MNQLIGVISDTHGLLRPSAVNILKNCDLILHAGDICGQEIIDALQALQRTVFVRGNMDRFPPGGPIHGTASVEFAGKHFFMLHDVSELDLDPIAAGIDVVIYGHSHSPDIAYRDGVLFLNPGSIGPKRFTLPISMAVIRIENQTLHPEIITLNEQR
ncbi:metallophosphoesterase family protein [Desulfonatronum parangueonense]